MTSAYTILLALDTAGIDERDVYAPKDIFESLPAHRHVDSYVVEEGWSVQDRKLKHKRKVPERRVSKDWRFGPLRVDWTDFPTGQMDNTSQAQTSASTSKPSFTLTTVPPSSGSTNLPSGTIHLYRHPSAPPLPSDEADAGTLLAILALPTYFTPSDLLSFVAPVMASNSLAHIRVLRDQAPDRSIVLLKFRNKKSAEEFSEAYNGKTFNAMDPEVCHIVQIDAVVITSTTGAAPPPAPSSTSISNAPSNGLELPTCAVCLERMDSGVTGLITVPCTHTFHCSCLSRWVDSRCPVCRASTAHSSSLRASTSHDPTPAASAQGYRSDRDDRASRCADCPTTSSLWICLICGNLGCGRYSQAHAAAHYQLTMHTFALELETQRVWDYAGDTYVHRLIRNRADGKVVELPSAGTSGNATNTAGPAGGRERGPGPEEAQQAEKMEAMGVEYGLLLTAQLETQRTWYEEKIEEVERRLGEALNLATAPREKPSVEVEADKQRLSQEDDRTKSEHAARERAERKAQQATELVRRLQSELAAERAVSSGLLENLSASRAREEAHAKEREEWKEKMQDMEEQLRDIMIFLQARDKIESGEIAVDGVAGGTVELPPVPTTPKSAGGKKKRTGKR